MIETQKTGGILSEACSVSNKHYQFFLFGAHLNWELGTVRRSPTFPSQCLPLGSVTAVVGWKSKGKIGRVLGLRGYLAGQGKAKEADKRNPEKVGEKDCISSQGRGRASEPSRDKRDKEGTMVLPSERNTEGRVVRTCRGAQ